MEIIVPKRRTIEKWTSPNKGSCHFHLKPMKQVRIWQRCVLIVKTQLAFRDHNFPTWSLGFLLLPAARQPAATKVKLHLQQVLDQITSKLLLPKKKANKLSPYVPTPTHPPNNKKLANLILWLSFLSYIACIYIHMGYDPGTHTFDIYFDTHFYRIHFVICISTI